MSDPEAMTELVTVLRKRVGGRGWWLFLLTLLAACGGEPQVPTPPPADAVATWDGGALALAEVESAFAAARTRSCRRARLSGGAVEELLPCYLELAEGLALERLVLAEVEDVDAALAGLEDYDLLRRHAYLETWRRRLRDRIEIDVEGKTDRAWQFTSLQPTPRHLLAVAVRAETLCRKVVLHEWTPETS